MHPVPKLIVMQIAIDVSLISIILRVFLGIANLTLVAQGRVYVILVKIFVPSSYRTHVTDLG
jgi:hypothetical protein